MNDVENGNTSMRHPLAERFAAECMQEYRSCVFHARGGSCNCNDDVFSCITEKQERYVAFRISRLCNAETDEEIYSASVDILTFLLISASFFQNSISSDGYNRFLQLANDYLYESKDGCEINLRGTLSAMIEWYIEAREK
jgi:hypothetical protein